jgi:hypothetical protein
MLQYKQDFCPVCTIRNGQKNIDQKIQLQIRGEEDLGKIKLQEHANFKKTRKEILDFEKALSAAVRWEL